MPRHCVLSALLLALVGCAGLTGPKKDYTIYAPNPETATSTGAPVNWQLLIEEPHVDALLNDFRIVIATSGNERQVFGGARWTERTPTLLQGIWLRAFEADGRLPGAARSGTGVRADLILSTDVIAFQAREHAEGVIAEIEIHARLIDPRNRRIHARRVLRAEAPAGDNRAASAVAAFDDAFSRLNPELVEWTLREGQTLVDATGGE
jgi:cholesterol transport system auxiliary component